MDVVNACYVQGTMSPVQGFRSNRCCVNGVLSEILDAETNSVQAVQRQLVMSLTRGKPAPGIRDYARPITA